LDTVVIGVSTDTLKLQEKFTEKEKLTFPLVADTEQKAAKAFGVIAAGKTTAQRATFVIDKEGNIAKIYAPVKSAGDHPGEVLEFVRTKLKKE
jgi:peroxiredoxin Q/BCP